MARLIGSFSEVEDAEDIARLSAVEAPVEEHPVSEAAGVVVVQVLRSPLISTLGRAER